MSPRHGKQSLKHRRALGEKCYCGVCQPHWDRKKKRDLGVDRWIFYLCLFGMPIIYLVAQGTYNIITLINTP